MNKSRSPHILVGIGYKDAFFMDKYRDRDYTAPASAAMKLSGGADYFHAFIQYELIPYIDRNYGSDTMQRTLMGHSLGGYFVLYALNRHLKLKQPLFRNYVSASPSLEYSNAYILKQFATRTHSFLPKYLHISIGQLEEEGELYNKFLDIAAIQSILSIKSKIYPGYQHMETAIPTFIQALKIQ